MTTLAERLESGVLQSVAPVYSDIDAEYGADTDGDLLRKTEIDAIKNSLTNILSTTQKTRRMLPEFGTNLQLLVFEPIDGETANTIGNAIIEGIKRWDDRVAVDTVDIEPIYDQNLYRCRINYFIKSDSTNDLQTINFVLKS
jgi:phage baseplate assembly protein W